jgi:peptide/nickel transport system permease protein
VTTGLSAELLGGAAAAPPPSRTLISDTWRQFRRHRLAVFGLVVFGLLTVVSVGGPLVYPQPIDGIDMTARLKPPTGEHLMGTDNLGQDVLAGVLFGGRISLAVGVVAMLLSVLVGTAIGAAAGYFHGAADQVLMRLTDLFIFLPQLPLLLLIYFFRDPLRKSFGTELGTFVLIVAVIGGLRWMSVARLVRASFLVIQNSEYIEAARCIGVPGGRLVLRHLLPNALSPVIVAASLAVGSAILAESTLSFLGLGFPPDVPTGVGCCSTRRTTSTRLPTGPCFRD